MDQMLLTRTEARIDLDALQRFHAASPEASPERLPAADAASGVGAAEEALGLIRRGLDLLAALAPADLPAAVGLATTAELLVVQDRVQALALRHVADVHTRDLWALDGSVSTGTWVEEQHTSMPRAHVTLAGRLDKVPQVAGRIAAGGLSVDAGMDLGAALEKLRPHVDRPDGHIDGQPAAEALHGVIADGICQLIGEVYGGLADTDPRIMAAQTELRSIAGSAEPEIGRLESAFLLLARHVPRRLLRKALAVLVDALLPNQLAERSDDAHARRSLELTRQPNGSGWLLRGTLDDECGERLHTALTAVMTTDPENPTDTATRRGDDGPAAGSGEPPEVEPADGSGETPEELGEPRRPRSKTQRRQDALNLLLDKILASSTLGSRGKAPVQIGVLISNAALHDHRLGRQPLLIRGQTAAALQLVQQGGHATTGWQIDPYGRMHRPPAGGRRCTSRAPCAARPPPPYADPAPPY